MTDDHRVSNSLLAENMLGRQNDSLLVAGGSVRCILDSTVDSSFVKGVEENMAAPLTESLTQSALLWTIFRKGEWRLP